MLWKKNSNSKKFIFMHIGKQIESVVRSEGRSVGWLAKNISCERANVYNIFKRRSIDTNLLAKISEVLNHNFFEDIANETKRDK